MKLFSNREEEFHSKLNRLRDWMAQEKIKNLLITQSHNFSWLTCGGENFVFFAQSQGSAYLLVTQETIYLASNNIETDRVYKEEIRGLPIENGEHLWHLSQQAVQNHYAHLSEGEIVTDVVVEHKLKVLREPLYPDEIERYKWLGARAEEAIREVAFNVNPNMTEYETASMLSREVLKRECWPVVMLTAADERASHYRHPLPTSKTINDYVMLVLGARRFGLIASVTRIVSFKPLSEELKHKHQSVCKVDAALNLNTKPGWQYSDVLQKGIDMYQSCGYGEEWHLHHQGGPAGYLGRSLKATPESRDKVLVNQVVAWNPSIKGTKSEDTIIVRENGIEVITQAKNWPMIKVELNGQTMERCDILIR